MYAVVKTGGKQYRVTENQKLAVEKLPGNPGDTLLLDNVLMIEDGSAMHVGAPVIEGAKVVATIAEQARSRKVLIFKKTRRHTYRRKKGHRQDLTVLHVHQIARPGDKVAEINPQPAKTKPEAASATQASQAFVAQDTTAVKATKPATEKTTKTPAIESKASAEKTTAKKAPSKAKKES